MPSTHGPIFMYRRGKMGSCAPTFGPIKSLTFRFLCPVVMTFFLLCYRNLYISTLANLPKFNDYHPYSCHSKFSLHNYFCNYFIFKLNFKNKFSSSMIIIHINVILNCSVLYSKNFLNIHIGLPHESFFLSFLSVLKTQLRFKPLPMPAREPDSSEPIFGKDDLNAEKMIENRRRAFDVMKEQMDTVAQRKRDAILRRLSEQKEEETVLQRVKEKCVHSSLTN